jgi:mercuric ion transport protein
MIRYTSVLLLGLAAWGAPVVLQTRRLSDPRSLAMHNTPSDRTQKFTLGGAILAAFAAASCCLGPLLLAALGLGGAGAFAILGGYRTYLLVGAAALLAGGFSLTYRKPRAVEGGACTCERSSVGRAGKVGLWVAVVVVALLAATPRFLASLANHSGESATTPLGAAVERATIRVEGIDCEACGVPLRGALTKVGGFRDLKLDLNVDFG